jgi:hypothetical protein
VLLKQEHVKNADSNPVGLGGPEMPTKVPEATWGDISLKARGGLWRL